MIRRRCRFFSNRGQSAVEFAFVAPVLFTIIFAVIDISWVMYQTHTLDCAARQAARYGAVGQTDAQMRTYIKGFCTGLNVQDGDVTIIVMDPSGVTLAPGTRTPKSGYQILVYVDHDLQFFTYIDRVFKGMNATRIRAQSQFTID